MIHDNSSQHESASTLHSILVGACGWQQAHWSGDFYPEDLPEDWLLSYYANEYPTVLVPATSWQAAAEDIEEWRDEVHEGFRFYLQRGIKNIGDEISSAEQQLGSQFAGFVDYDADLRSDVQIDKQSAVAVIKVQSKDLRGWSEWLKNNASGLRAIFLSDQNLSYKELSEFKSLVELLNL